MSTELSPELAMLAWTLVLALFQILLTATLRTRETGLAYNLSSRDLPAPTAPGIVTGRCHRAQRNLFETLPIFAAAVLVAHVSGIESASTYWGTLLYFWGRVFYVPAYAFGIKYLRTLVWGVSIVGLVMLLVAILCPGHSVTLS